MKSRLEASPARRDWAAATSSAGRGPMVTLLIRLAPCLGSHLLE